MHVPLAVTILVVTYWTVLAVELIGDKTIYTVTSLATRFHPAHVYAGISAAFVAKMLAAVLFGRILLQLPVRLTATVTSITLLVTAVVLWRKQMDVKPAPPEIRRWASAFGTSFAAIFFSEWADVGQISAAALATRYDAPMLVWVGATAALMTKGLLALTLGVQFRRHVSPSVTKLAAVASFAILGLLSLEGVLGR